MTISIFDGFSYFDGASFSWLTELELPASGTAAWSSAAVSGYALLSTDYTITARARDAGGRVGVHVSSFTIDGMAPDCVSCFTLDAPSYPWTATTAVAASAPDVFDPNGPVMAFYDGDIVDAFAGTWIGFSSWQPLQLSPGDGPKTVTVRYSDALGNVSMVYSDTLTLDTTPPQEVAITLAGGAQAVSTTTISVSFTPDDAVKVDLWGDLPSLFGQPLTAVSDVTLFSGDGQKTVWAAFYDAAGNSSVTSATIMLDTVGPGLIVALPGLRDVVGVSPAGGFDGAKANDQAGNVLASTGDLDGDGIEDVLAGASWFTVSGQGFYHGAVYALSGLNLTPIWQRNGPGASFFYGERVASLDDLDGDGVREVIVGAPLADTGGTDTGFVEVLSGASGAPLFATAGTAASIRFGQQVAGTKDLNGDQTPDLLVGLGTGGFVGSGRGAVFALSGTDGSELWRRDGDADFEGLVRAPSSQPPTWTSTASPIS